MRLLIELALVFYLGGVGALLAIERAGCIRDEASRQLYHGTTLGQCTGESFRARLEALGRRLSA